MRELYEFKVAPYALSKSIEGLTNGVRSDEYMEIFVTQEDNDLVVRFRKHYIEKTNPQCCNVVEKEVK